MNDGLKKSNFLHIEQKWDYKNKMINYLQDLNIRVCPSERFLDPHQAPPSY